MNDVEISVFPKDDLGDFRALLKEHDIKFSERVFFRDSADSGMTFLGEFMVIGKELGGHIIVGVCAWLAARQGRKVRIKMGDIEAEAGTIEEVKELLAMVQKRSAENQTDQDEGSGPTQ